MFVHLHFIYIVGRERCPGKINWISLFSIQGNGLNSNHLEEYVGNIYCAFTWQPWICTSHARIHNIQKRRVHFIWRTTSSLSSYFKGAIQRFISSFDLIWNIMSKTGGVQTSLTPPLDPSMHRLTTTGWKKSELHWSPIVPCWENEYEQQEQIYPGNVVLLFCKSLCLSKKYLLRVHCIPIWK